MSGLIRRDEAIDALYEHEFSNWCDKDEVSTILNDLPDVKAIDEVDLLSWLLAYHKKSFDLKGRYMSHEVIGWLVHDLMQYIESEDVSENETVL